MKKILLALVLLVASSRAVDTLSIPTDFNSVSSGTRANLTSNFTAIQTWGNKIRDTLAPVTSKISGFSGTLLVRSLSNLRLKLDYDNTETARLLIESGNGDSLFAVVEDTTAKFYGSLTVNKKAVITDSLRVPAISSALSLAQTLGVTGKATFSDSIVGVSQRLTGNLSVGKVTGSDSIIGTGASFSGITLTPTLAAIGPNTADGSDNHVVQLNGGGGGTSSSITRGAILFLTGNENVANPGSIVFQAGNTSNAAFKFVLRASQNNAFTVNDGTLFYLTINTVSGSEALYFNRRACAARGASVTSANDVTLGTDGNVFKITGNTQLNRITSTGWQDGSEIVLHFTGTPTVKHQGAATSGSLARLNLSGSVDLVATANTRLRLYYDGTDWWETGRTTP